MSRVGRMRLFAVLAELADQPLGDDAVHCGCCEERFHSHLGEPGKRPGSVVRVQGGQDQVAGESRFDRDLGRVLVAHLTDHDDVGVATQDRSEAGREREPRLRVDLHLVDACQPVFHRVLDRDDVLVRRVEDIESGVQRGGLAGSGRTGDQDGPVRLLERTAIAVVEPARRTRGPRGAASRWSGPEGG